MLHLWRLDCETEPSTIYDTVVDPDQTAVGSDNPHADRKADTGPWIGLAGMKSLKHPMDSFSVLRFDTDAIVRNRERPLPVLPSSVDSYVVCDARSSELDGIGDDSNW